MHSKKLIQAIVIGDSDKHYTKDNRGTYQGQAMHRERGLVLWRYSK